MKLKRKNQEMREIVSQNMLQQPLIFKNFQSTLVSIISQKIAEHENFPHDKYLQLHTKKKLLYPNFFLLIVPLYCTEVQRPIIVIMSMNDTITYVFSLLISSRKNKQEMTLMRWIIFLHHLQSHFPASSNHNR